MFRLISDEVVEEKVLRGLTNELVWLEHHDAYIASKEKATILSNSLSPKERRFISEMKATSIILPFSASKETRKHLLPGDMVTLVQLIEVVGYLRGQGYSECIGCENFMVEMERGEDKKLIIHASSLDPESCASCRSGCPLLVSPAAQLPQKPL